MKLQLHINYFADQNQYLAVEINIDGTNQYHPMTQTSQGNWTFEGGIPHTSNPITYGYLVLNNDNTVVRREWCKQRYIHSTDAIDLIVADTWCTIPQNFPYYSTAFTKGFYQRAKNEPQKNEEQPNICFETLAPTLPPHADLILVGESDHLGNWDSSKALILNDSKAPSYTLSLPHKACHKGMQYKLAARCRNTNQIIAWDKGDNRTFPFDCPRDTNIIVRDLVFEPQMAPFRTAGVAIPVFSLRTKNSWAIGEYSDLKPIIDWAKLTGQKIIQILPINDTTLTHRWTDSYPYNANSIFALHPLYLNPTQIGTLDNKTLAEHYENRRKELNELDKVDYEVVDQLKWRYFRHLFDQQKATYQQDPTFQNWYQENRNWLIPYAAFCHLREQYSAPNFSCWGEFATYQPSKIAQLVETNNTLNDTCGIYIFLQYHAHLQLSDVTQYAHKQGIVLKGDIPIGISRNSVEAWVEPYLFNLNGQAGAPPDDFSKNGQNWGFPTYRWEEMAKDGFAWWKARFKKMAQYFDAYRIDHLLGFFRIWQIPMHSVEGLLGHFNPALPLTPNEIEQYGLRFDPNQMTAPCLTAEQVNNLFGKNASFAFQHLLRSIDHCFTPKPEYTTQRDVQNTQFTVDAETETALKQALFALINDVLFVEDPQQKGTYHPRIAAYDTFAFCNLDEHARQAFSRLYEEFFFVRHNEYWKQTATDRLSELIGATNMLVCAEDLGMIPACVPQVMDEMQMLSLEIQRMPKTFGEQFANTATYPYLSVAATSTHDMSTIRQWWEEDRDATQHYYNHQLHQHGEAPLVCTQEIATQIVHQHLTSPAMLTILPLQDWLAIDQNIRHTDCQAERINVPANPKHYWQYRMHLNIEQLLEAADLNDKLKNLIQQSGRQ